LTPGIVHAIVAPVEAEAQRNILPVPSGILDGNGIEHTYLILVTHVVLKRLGAIFHVVPSPAKVEPRADDRPVVPAGSVRPLEREFQVPVGALVYREAVVVVVAHIVVIGVHLLFVLGEHFHVRAQRVLGDDHPARIVDHLDGVLSSSAHCGDIAHGHSRESN
jgi:hypothetical protein